MSWDTLYLNANLITFDQSDAPYGLIKNGALAIEAGKIVWIGKQSDLPKQDTEATQKIIDLHGQYITPGLIDCHTHLIYGGHRAKEFEMRLNGATYEEIAQAGGGIISTVNATREADEQTLYLSAKQRLDAMKMQGVTTVEIKSGYGLDFETEIKLLTVAKELADDIAIDIHPTFLGAHTIPKEYKSNPEQYVDLVTEKMLPYIAEHKLATSVDVFCEGIAFNLAQTESVFKAAKQHGLKIKAHAEQLTNLGCTHLAAQYGALSTDHLEHIDEAAIKAMAKANMTAVLLPGAFYFLKETKKPPVALFRQYNIPMAIATDCNPGTSPGTSLLMIINMACQLYGLTPEEALAGATINAAKALGIQNTHGTLTVGKQADLAIWDIDYPAMLAYGMGNNLCVTTIKNGR